MQLELEIEKAKKQVILTKKITVLVYAFYFNLWVQALTKMSTCRVCTYAVHQMLVIWDHLEQLTQVGDS